MISPDPYKASAGAKDPKSWNRYTYVLGDPISYNDTGGLCASVPVFGGGLGDDDPCDPDPCWDEPWLCDPFVPPAPPAPSIFVTCDISIFVSDVPGALGVGGHVTIEDNFETFINGKVFSVVSLFFQAQPGTPGTSNECSPGDTILGKCYLDSVTKGLASSSSAQAGPVGSTDVADTGYSTYNCPQAYGLITLSGLYPNNKFRYNPAPGLNPFAANGYNSNNFAYNLLFYDGFLPGTLEQIYNSALNNGFLLYGWWLFPWVPLS
jgi:hypothetical protein